MKICTKCHAEAYEGDFCTYCGAPLVAKQVAQPLQVPQPQQYYAPPQPPQTPQTPQPYAPQPYTSAQQTPQPQQQAYTPQPYAPQPPYTPQQPPQPPYGYTNPPKKKKPPYAIIAIFAISAIALILALVFIVPMIIGFFQREPADNLLSELSISQNFGDEDAIDENDGYITEEAPRAGRDITVSISTEISARYDGIGTFSEGLAPVYVYVEAFEAPGHYSVGYIDKHGNEVIPLELSYEYWWLQSGDFPRLSDGMLAAQKDGLWGYYNSSGNIVIPFIHHFASDFSDGLAYVYDGEIGEGSWSFIDRTGSKVFSTPYTWVGGFFEGLAGAGFMEWEEGFFAQSGFIDQHGNVAIPFDYTYTRGFSEGLAAVAVGDWESGIRWGYIDRTGRVVIPFEYREASDFSDGMAAVVVGDDWENRKFGYIDREGNVIIPFNYNVSMYYDEHEGSFIPPKFSNGIAAISVGTWDNFSLTIIGKDGEMALPADEYDWAGTFSDGLLAVRNRTTEKWGYIDINGRVVVPFEHLIAGDFSDGVAVVASGSWDNLTWSVLAIDNY